MPVIRCGPYCREPGCSCPIWDQPSGLCVNHARLFRAVGRSLDVVEVDSDSPEFEAELMEWLA